MSKNKEETTLQASPIDGAPLYVRILSQRLQYVRTLIEQQQ